MIIKRYLVKIEGWVLPIIIRETNGENACKLARLIFKVPSNKEIFLIWRLEN